MSVYPNNNRLCTHLHFNPIISQNNLNKIYKKLHALLVLIKNEKFHAWCPFSFSFASTDMVEDTEDKNLSWLFNFKLDDIANLSPEIKRKRTTTSSNSNSSQNSGSQQQHENPHQTPHNNYQQQLEEITQQQQQLVEDDELNVAENVVISNTPTVGSTSGTTSHMWVEKRNFLTQNSCYARRNMQLSDFNALSCSSSTKFPKALITK